MRQRPPCFRPRRVSAAAAALGALLLPGATAAAASPAMAATSAPAAVSAAAAPAVSAGTWGRARKVPGLAAVNTGADAGIGPMSCASPGNCTGAGTYSAGPGKNRAFAISRVHGTWRPVRKIPGLAALGTGGAAAITSVSCSSAGNCGAGGSYRAGKKNEAFVATQARGAWGRARKIPGLAALNAGGEAAITSVSCSSAGNCTAAGRYAASAAASRPFVVSQVHGTWGRARALPGLAALSTGSAGIGQVSCGSAGNCSAGGLYADHAGNDQAFVVTQARGTWGRALEVPGLAALNTGGSAVTSSVSCASAGNCSAGGSYDQNATGGQAFVVSEVHGTWGTAQQVPGTAALNRYGDAQVLTVSCASAGNCSAGGRYADRPEFGTASNGQAFVVTQTRGTWGTALEVPGTARLDTGDDALVGSVSCASPGNCSAGGQYGIGTVGQKVYNFEAFVVSEVNGRWGRALEVPGTAALNTGKSSGIGQVSCAAPGRCSAGGSYAVRPGGTQAFLVTQS